MSLLLTALALYSRVCSATWIQPRQYWPDPNPIARTAEECLQISFTNPRWGIFGPSLVVVNSSSDGTQGDIQFSTVNSATGLAANCTARDIELHPKDPDAEEAWHNCSIPNLSFQFSLPSLEMRLRGSWQCDNSSSFVFVASGPWEVPLIQGCLDDPKAARGEETLCIMGNSQVAAGLSSPVSIYPQLPLYPYTPRERGQRCVDRSYDPEWETKTLLYQHHFGQDGNESYELSVELTNISDNQEAQCSVQVDLSNGFPSNGSAPWVRCGTKVSANTSLEVSFDVDYGVLGVRQTWGCTDGVEGVEPDHFLAIGYTNVGLDCTKLTSGNTFDLKAGDTPDYNCSLSNSPVTFTGYLDSTPLMPHTYYASSCTVKSITSLKSMGLRSYRLESSSAPNSLIGTFALHNPGSGDTYRLRQMPLMDNGGWHECVAGSKPLPWQLVKCQYRLDRENHRLGFQVEWYCDDRDPSHAILFKATVEQQLPAEVCNREGRRETCVLPVDVAELEMPVAALTWESSTKPMDRGPTLPWI